MYSCLNFPIPSYLGFRIPYVHLRFYLVSYVDKLEEFFRSAFYEVNMVITPWAYCGMLTLNSSERTRICTFLFNIDTRYLIFLLNIIIDTAEAIPLALWAMYIRKRFKGESNSKRLTETMAKSIKEL